MLKLIGDVQMSHAMHLSISDMLPVYLMAEIR